MSLDVYFRKDIANALEALYVAGEGETSLLFEQMNKVLKNKQQRQELAEQMQTYQRGYQDALLAVALAFGVIEKPKIRLEIDRKDRSPLLKS